MKSPKDATVYNEYEVAPATAQQGLTPDHRRIKVRSHILSEIGKITEAIEEKGWTTILTDAGDHMSMTSRYHRFRQVREQAHRLKEQGVDVVARCGASANPDGYFNALYEDRNPRGFPMLAFPDESILKQVAGVWLMERMYYQENKERDIAIAVQETAAARDEYKQKFEQLERREKNEITYSRNWLKENWNEFQRLTDRLPISGNQNTHARRVLALRGGIDMSKRQRLLVRPIEHRSGLKGGNYILVQLPEHENRELLLAIIRRKKQKDFFIASCDSIIPNWYDHEPPGAKDADEPLSWHLALHEQIMDAIYPPTVVRMQALAATMNLSSGRKRRLE